MKKIWLLFLGLFLVLGFVSCEGEVTIPSGLITTGDTTAETTGEQTEVVTEAPIVPQLDIPSQLSIDDETQVLSWEEVEDATGYSVYVDGVFEAEVTGTSYDFSALQGDNLTFTVKALAPAGMSDSQLSATIAYVADRTSAIAAMQTAVSNAEMNYNGLSPNNPTAFATELVNKGMTPAGYEAMMSNMADLESLNTLTDMNDMYTLIDDVLNAMDMTEVEALISSLIKTELLPALQEELTYYEQMNDMYGYYTEDIAMYEAMITFLENNADEAVRSVMVVVEYFMDIENAIDSQMISNFESLLETDSPETFDTAIFISLKDDMVQMFKDNLPSLEDVILLNSTLMAFAEVYAGESADLSLISVSKQSTLELLNLELFFNFLLAIDADYVDAFIDFGSNPDFAPAKTFVKENIDMIDAFIDDNASIIEDMNDVYTVEEAEALYVEVMTQSLIASTIQMYYRDFSQLEITALETGIQLLVEENLDFSSMLLLGEAMNENMNDLLDAIIASDYAIVDSIFDLAELSNQRDYLTRNDDYFDANFVLEYEIVSAGTYYVKVRGFSEYEAGEYQISITYNGVPVVDEFATLEPGEEDYYSFEVTEEEAGEYMMAMTQGSLDTYGYLLTEEMYLGIGSELTQEEAVLQVIVNALDLFNPMIQDATLVEYNAMLDVVFSSLEMQFGAMNLVEEDFTQQLAILSVVKTAFENTAEEQLNIFKSLSDKATNESYITDFVDYMRGYDENPDTEFAAIIMIANALLDFYEENSSDIEAIIDEVIVALSDEDVMQMIGISPQNLIDLETDIDNYISEIITSAEGVADYDYNSLTEIQMEELYTFIDLLMGLF
jgi:hypothetical protein